MIVDLETLPEPLDTPRHRAPWSAEQHSVTHSRVVDCLGDHVCDVRIRHHGDHVELERKLSYLNYHGDYTKPHNEGVEWRDEWNA